VHIHRIDLAHLVPGTAVAQGRSLGQGHMAPNNRPWEEQIRGGLLKLGLLVAKRTVQKYLWSSAPGG
jgi:hypothetical protein